MSADTRTDGPPHGGVPELMDRDHGRLDSLVREVADRLEQGDPDAARQTLDALRTGLRLHIRIEEELLLPVIAERLVSPRGPAALLHEQHLGIEARLADLDRVMAEGGDAQQVGTSIAALRALLQEHVSLEQRSVYPAVDRLLDPCEREELIRRFQAVWTGNSG